MKAQTPCGKCLQTQTFTEHNQLVFKVLGEFSTV